LPDRNKQSIAISGAIEDWIVPLSPTATSWLLPAAIPFKLFKVAEFLGVQESPSLET